MSFIYFHLNFHANLLRPWRFPLISSSVHIIVMCNFWYDFQLVQRSQYFLETINENYLKGHKVPKSADDFNFPIVNVPFICSNIPAAPAYEVYIFQLIWYSRDCGYYYDFLDRGLLLTGKLLNQGYLVVKLKSSLRKFYDHHHDFINCDGISVQQRTTDMFRLS